MNDIEATRRFCDFLSSKILRSVELVRVSTGGNRLSRKVRSARAFFGWNRPIKNAKSATKKKNRAAET
jgi:hypothetical protein